MSPPPRRFAQIIRLRPEHADEYMRLHAAVWPSVLHRIHQCGIRDYSIFYDQPTTTTEAGAGTGTGTGTGLLFASFKYVGTDFEADMAKMAEDEETRKWWAITDGMQESLNPGATGSEAGSKGVPWWRALREVFYVE